MTVTNRIKKIRTFRNITQEQLADSVNVSRQTIIAMEKGNYIPSLLLALELGKFFKTNVEELFTLK